MGLAIGLLSLFLIPYTFWDPTPSTVFPLETPFYF